MTTLDELRSGDAPILLLATGACLGEGVDLAASDTLFLASSISGRSRVVQYVGRVTRPLPDKDQRRTSTTTTTSSTPCCAACTSDNRPILLALNELSLVDARNRLSELVADVEKVHARVTITKHGHPAAVLISPEDLATLEETLGILSDPGALGAIRKAEAELDRVEFTSGEEMAEMLEQRRRRTHGAA